MKSPFPGMDPYLEIVWGSVHPAMIVHAIESLNRVLPDDLYAQTEKYVAVEAPDDDRSSRYFPDVAIAEYPEAEPMERVATSAAVAEPVVLRLSRQPRKLHRINILESGATGKLITVIEIVSPSNAIGREGRKAYKKKRREFLAAKVNFVEIDLLRDGDYILYPPESAMRGRLRTPYHACAIRAHDPSTVEIYPFSLRTPLAGIRIPLRKSDEDAVLDLQRIVAETYERGRFAQIVDYNAELSPKLADDDAAWVDELLKNAKKR